MKTLTVVICILLFSSLAYGLTTLTVKETETVKVRLSLYDPDNDSISLTYTPPLDKNGEWKTDYGDAGNYKAKVMVSDGKDTVEEDLLIVVEKKEEKPFIEGFSPQESSAVLNEGESLSFSLTAKDIDKDVLRYSWDLDGQPVGSENTFVYSPGFNGNGLHALNVQVTDGKTTLSKGWLIKVENTDRPAVFTPIQNISLFEGQKVTIAFDVSDPDGDHVIVSGENMPFGANITNNVFTWTPDFNAVDKTNIKEKLKNKLHLLSKEFPLTFRASSNNLSVIQSVVLTIKQENRAPVFDDNGVREITAGDLLSINPVVHDPDGDFIETTFSGWASENTKQTTTNDKGTHYVTVQSSDGFLDTEKQFTIVVKEKQTELLGDQGEYRFQEGDIIKIPVNIKKLGTDVSLYSGPTGAVVKDGFFEWNPDFSVALPGEKKGIIATIKGSDGQQEDFSDLKLIIENKNQPPVITHASPNPISYVYLGQAVPFSVDVVDPDGDQLTYYWDVDMFERYTAGPIHDRVFTTEGTKKIRVRVSDGVDEISTEWAVQVVKKVQPVLKEPIVYEKFEING